MVLVTTPGSTVTVRLARSTSRMRFIRSTERSIPPNTGTAPPESPDPAPRGVTGMRSRLASRMIRAISSAVAGLTTTSGICAYSAPATSSWL